MQGKKLWPDCQHYNNDSGGIKSQVRLSRTPCRICRMSEDKLHSGPWQDGNRDLTEGLRKESFGTDSLQDPCMRYKQT